MARREWDFAPPTPGSPEEAKLEMELLKQRAWATVTRALKKGVIKKAKECYHCGPTRRRLFAHHHDYTKPLDVDWLCQRCHMSQHVFLADPRNHQKPWTGVGE